MTPLARQHVAVLTRDKSCRALRLGLPGSCSGHLECSHVIPKQAIKRRQRQLLIRLAHGKPLTPAERRLTDTDIDLVISDPRGALAICHGHHTRADLLGQRGERDLLPEHVFEFVAEFGLHSELDRLYRPLRAAA